MKQEYVVYEVYKVTCIFLLNIDKFISKYQVKHSHYIILHQYIISLLT